MSRYERRLADEHLAGNISRAERDAILATRSLLQNGNPTPSHHQIARRAGCSRRTVQRAHAKAGPLGLLLTWPQFAGRNGRQSANRYRLTEPRLPVQVRQRWRTPKKSLFFLPKSEAWRALEAKIAREKDGARLPLHGSYGIALSVERDTRSTQPRGG